MQLSTGGRVWQVRYTAISSAKPEALWDCYTQVASWPNWDSDVKTATLHGDFVTGANGLLQPQRGPRNTFILTEVTQNQSFSNESRLPGARIRFDHTLTALPDNCTKVTHTISIYGSLYWLFRWLIGKSLAQKLPTAVNNLAKYAASLNKESL